MLETQRRCRRARRDAIAASVLCVPCSDPVPSPTDYRIGNPCMSQRILVLPSSRVMASTLQPRVSRVLTGSQWRP